VDEIKNVWVLPDASDPSYAYKVELLTWYVGKLLPYAVGNEWLPPHVLFYKIIVEPVMVTIGAQAPKKQPSCSAWSESMGWVIYENCYDKWKLICEARDKDPEFKVPKYNKDKEDTHKWNKTKWSDPRGGKVELGGWKPAAHNALKDNRQTIVAFRKQDHANKFPVMKLALKLVRAKEEITATEHSKKRKRGKSKDDPPPVYVDMDSGDEEDYFDDGGDESTVGEENP